MKSGAFGHRFLLIDTYFYSFVFAPAHVPERKIRISEKIFPKGIDKR